MTNEEAISILQNTSFFGRSMDDIDTAIDMAIEALEQEPSVLADMLMEERIKGKLDSDITYSKDIIPDVKCKLTVSIQDHRPCYCGAELREVWRERKKNIE